MTVRTATPKAIAEAATLLREGRLVAFPTETVYGLGADATNARAVAAIFEVKGRPRFNPLIVHVPSLKHVSALAELTAAGRELADAFWPGPLTLVLRKASGCPVADLATAGLETIAVRIPADPIGRALLEAAGMPIAAPSANRSGHVSPTTAAHVAGDLGDRVAMILDGGSTLVGLESTVVDVTSDMPVVLRPGGIMREEIAQVLGQPVSLASDQNNKPASPGMLSRHYAPRTRLRLDAIIAQSGEALLAFGPQVPPHDGPRINLSRSGNLVEAATNLFAALRALDSTGAAAIAVMPIPESGLGEAINDRLRRAAEPGPA
jgi:L-threonylcarbamoyladenylate synthase